MKNIFSLLLMVAILVTASMAIAGPDLSWTSPNNFHSSSQAPVQIFAPNGTTTTALAVTSTTVDLTNYVMFGLESGSGTTCYMRMMPTSATGTYARTLVRIAGSQIIRAKNPATPFVNFSGCTAGSYTLQ